MTNSNGYYIDLTIIPSDISANFILSKIYCELHLGLVSMKDENDRVPVGFAFPEYRKNKNLGEKLRLFSLEKEPLETLNPQSLLANMLDYVHITSIREVGHFDKYVMYKRKQYKSNKERLARRIVKRKGITFDKAMESLGSFEEKTSRLPYLKLKSISNGNQFKLFIEESIIDNIGSSTFNTYGLSDGISAVPI